jgi:hypothetical protein
MANVYVQGFLLPMEASDGETPPVDDIDFNSAYGHPPHPRFCPKGTHDECVLMQTTSSMEKIICGLKGYFVFSFFISKQDWPLFQ